MANMNTLGLLNIFQQDSVFLFADHQDVLKGNFICCLVQLIKKCQ